MTHTHPIKMTLTAEGGLSGSWEFTSPAAITIGRSEEAEVRPLPVEAARSLSRRHAVINLTPEGAVIRDLGSLNGTWLNGLLVGKRDVVRQPDKNFPEGNTDVRLANGDILTLGRFIIRVNLGSANEAAALCPGHEEFQCPACGNNLMVSEKTAPDALCRQCRSNPVAALKMLRNGLNRGVKSLEPLKGLRIDKTLGRGATSAVFLAIRKDCGRRLALKVMPPAVSDNEWARRSFLREAALGRALNHPNVARMYEFGSYNGTYFALMEYCEGGSSEELRVKSGGRLTVEEGLRIILPVLDGLEYMHTVRLATADPLTEVEKEVLGLVHRDLKPANIFLSGPEGFSKIADIGVAKFHGSGGSCHTRTGAMAGSPATMPRQQAVNFKYAGPEVDIWAAAASLFKLTTGQYPREFPSDRDPWRVVMNESPRPVRSIMPDYPDNLAAALDQALIDDPSITHQSAESLKKALSEAARLDGIDI